MVNVGRERDTKEKQRRGEVIGKGVMSGSGARSPTRKMRRRASFELYKHYREGKEREVHRGSAIHFEGGKGTPIECKNNNSY